MPFDGAVMETRLTATPSRPLSLSVRMPDGGILSPTAAAGARLIDALAAFGIPIRPECAAREPSSVYRARVAWPWADRLPMPDPEEQAVLARLEAQGGEARGGAIRLLGKVVMTPDLDGLELELSWDSLIPQTYWIAG